MDAPYEPVRIDLPFHQIIDPGEHDHDQRQNGHNIRDARDDKIGIMQMYIQRRIAHEERPSDGPEYPAHSPHRK